MNYAEEFTLLDVINILSFILGMENLQENREQSAGSTKLLKELSQRFDEQDKLLHKILEVLEHDGRGSVCKHCKSPD